MYPLTVDEVHESNAFCKPHSQLKCQGRLNCSERLFKRAQEILEENPNKKEVDRQKAKIQGFKTQLDVLAERLSELPKSVSAGPIFKQMESIESQREQTEKLLRQFQAEKVNIGKPAELSDFMQFTKGLNDVFRNGSAETREKVIKRLIHKVEMDLKTVTIHYIVDSRNFLKNVGSNSLTNGRG